MNRPSWRHGVLAAVVLLGFAASSRAQAIGTFPHAPASDVIGVWYQDGNPELPCYVNVAPGARMAIFTDAAGQKARGRIMGRGRVVLNVAGTPLTGEVDGDILYWSDGSYWTR